MMIVMTAVWLIVLVVVLAVVWQLIARRGSSDHGGSAHGRAEEILRERYARGDIDRDTYQRMMDDLRHHAQS